MVRTLVTCLFVLTSSLPAYLTAADQAPPSGPSIQAPLDPGQDRLEDAYRRGDWRAVLRLAHRVVRLDPNRVEAYDYALEAARACDRPSAFTHVLDAARIPWMSPASLNHVAWCLVTQTDFAYVNLDIALDMAAAAVDQAPRSGAIRDTYARALYLAGDLFGALEEQRCAVDLAPHDRAISRTLAYYEAVWSSRHHRRHGGWR